MRISSPIERSWGGSPQLGRTERPEMADVLLLPARHLLPSIQRIVVVVIEEQRHLGRVRGTAAKPLDGLRLLCHRGKGETGAQCQK